MAQQEKINQCNSPHSTHIKENYLITSIFAEKAFEKDQYLFMLKTLIKLRVEYLFMIKTLIKLRVEVNILELIKLIYQNLTYSKYTYA